MGAPRPQRNRIHIDVWVPHDQAEARVAAAIEAGGRLVTDAYAPSWWTLADAEGNEADVHVAGERLNVGDWRVRSRPRTVGRCQTEARNATSS